VKGVWSEEVKECGVREVKGVWSEGGEGSERSEGSACGVREVKGSFMGGREGASSGKLRGVQK